MKGLVKKGNGNKKKAQRRRPGTRGYVLHTQAVKARYAEPLSLDQIAQAAPYLK